MKQNQKYLQFIDKPAPIPPKKSDYPNKDDLARAQRQHKIDRQSWKYANSAPVKDRIAAAIAEKEARNEAMKQWEAEYKALSDELNGMITYKNSGGDVPNYLIDIHKEKLGDCIRNMP